MKEKIERKKREPCSGERGLTFGMAADAYPLARGQAARKFQSGKRILLTVVLLALTLSQCSRGPQPIHANPGKARVSLEDLLDRAEQGEVEAQVTFGLRYKHGMQVPQDFGEALKWLRRASRQGNAFAQARLGAMYRDGLGVTRNDAEAVKWFRRSAGQGDSTAQLALGILYREGKGVPQDDKEALRWLRAVTEGSSNLPPEHFDYWDVPPIVPSPILPIQIGEARRHQCDQTLGEGQPPPNSPRR